MSQPAPAKPQTARRNTPIPAQAAGAPRRKPELLAPAGTLEKLKIAVHYGADAVYLAGTRYGLRAFAGNFTPPEMAEGIAFAHAHGAKVYVTVNIFAHNEDLDGLEAYLLELESLGADAILLSDPGILRIARRTVPALPIHISTQANTTNYAAVQQWQDLGAARVVLARELSLSEIREIRARTTAELELFVHGAMCISYSGRCLLSRYMADRDANRGACAQACRWNYHLVEEKRPGEFYPIQEDAHGSYVFNSQDLCLFPELPRLMDAGLASFKIEGRMKSAYYVATVVRAYRNGIDACFGDAALEADPGFWMEELQKVSHRPYTSGFCFGRPEDGALRAESADCLKPYEFLGIVLDYDAARGIATVEERNRICVGDTVEFFGPHCACFSQTLTALWDREGHAIASAPHARQIVRLPALRPVEAGDLLRKPLPPSV